MEKYRYTIKSTRHSSEKFGPCEICNQHASEVFYQSEEKEYKRKGETHTNWTAHGCNNHFGHEQCLIGVRR